MSNLQYLGELLDTIKQMAEENVDEGRKIYEKTQQRLDELCGSCDEPEKTKTLLLESVRELYKESEEVLSSFDEFVDFITNGNKIISRSNRLNEAWKGDLYDRKGIKALKKLCRDLIETRAKFEEPYEDIVAQIF